MTTLYSGYPQPSSVLVAPVSGGKLEMDANKIFIVDPDATLTLHPVWKSDYTGAQVQYRTRSRVEYSAGLATDSTGAEVWTDWPSWPSPGTTATSNSQATRGTKKWRCATGVTLSFPYDFSTYDMHEVQVRVRVYSAQHDRASEWAYSPTISIIYAPEIASVTAETAFDGSLDVSFTTTFARPMDLYMWMGLDLRDGEIVGTWDDKLRFPAGITTRVPVDHLVKNRPDLAGGIWSQIWYLTETDRYLPRGNSRDSILWDQAYGSFSIKPAAHVNPSDVPVPTISVVSSTGGETVVSIGCACTGVSARATFTDSEGSTSTAYMDVTGTSPNWTATLEAPPFGVPITIEAACYNASGKYRLATQTVTVDSDAHCCLDGAGDHVELLYEGEFSQDSQLSGESIAVAGRRLPVARHGAQVSRSLRVKGTVLFPSVFASGDMELAALNVLDNPHDWIFRNPRGMRKRVRIASWSTEQDASQLGRLAEVSIDMEEVG